MPDPRLFKIRATLKGGHHHVGIWAGTPHQRANDRRPKLGDLIMDDDDLTALVAQMAAGAEALGVPLDVEGDAAGRTLSPAARTDRPADPRWPIAPRVSITDPNCLAYTENSYPPAPDDTAFDLTIDVAPPPGLDRVWVQVQGVMARRRSCASWSLSVFVNDGPMAWREYENWTDGQNAARPGYGNWVPVDRTRDAMTVRVRLDGADWVLPAPIPVRLTVTVDPPPNPYAPPVVLTPPAEIPHPDDLP